MNLNAYAADWRLRLFEELKAGREPSQGRFAPETLQEARAKGAPQLGATRYEPNAIHLEFIYPDQRGVATVFTVTLEAPERIVFLPVPEWVVESIWQGEIDGSYQFESDAKRMTDSFLAGLDPEKNSLWFGKRMAKRRE